MSDIRLTYTGVKYFILQITAYLISVIFPIYIARVVSTSEYGIYGFILSMWLTFNIFRNMIPFWAGRMIARGGRFVKSSFISNLILSIPLMIIYYVLIPFYPSSHEYFLVYLLSGLYIPLSYGIWGLAAYVKMKIPDKLGYGPFIVSLAKLSIGLLLVYLIGLFGAILTLLTGYLLYFLYFLKLSYKEFEDKIDFSHIREWIKGSWFAVLLSTSSTLYNNLAILILGFIGVTLSLGPYYVAVRVSRWIGLTTGLSIALSPRLLSESGGKRDVERIVDLSLLFAVPMLVGILVMNREIVYLFGGRKYFAAIIPLIILAIAKFLDVFTNIGISTILGLEKFDKKFMIKLSELIKSDMFKVLVIRYLGLSILVIAIIILYPILDIVGLALSTLIASITFFSLIAILSIKKLGLISNVKIRIFKYTLSSLVMSMIIYLIPKYRSLLIVLAIVIGILTYFSFLYIIDRDFRVLVWKGWREITRIITSYLSIEE